MLLLVLLLLLKRLLWLIFGYLFIIVVFLFFAVLGGHLQLLLHLLLLLLSRGVRDELLWMGLQLALDDLAMVLGLGLRLDHNTLRLCCLFLWHFFVVIVLLFLDLTCRILLLKTTADLLLKLSLLVAKGLKVVVPEEFFDHLD